MDIKLGVNRKERFLIIKALSEKKEQQGFAPRGISDAKSRQKKLSQLDKVAP